jgi:hypothetical protein
LWTSQGTRQYRSSKPDASNLRVSVVPPGKQSARRATLAREETRMIMTLVVVLLVLWLLGMITNYTLGGLLHILLVVAVIALLIRVIRGRPI